ncbi:hypothetical protein [Streptosporangium sp. KLBMP 9127]
MLQRSGVRLDDPFMDIIPAETPSKLFMLDAAPRGHTVSRTAT